MSGPAPLAQRQRETDTAASRRFLIDRRGSVVERFASNPTAKEPLIRELLAAAAA